MQSLPIDHSVLHLEGWTVYVDRRLQSAPHHELGRLAVKLLGAKLVEVSLGVPEDRLERLRRVPIWLDLSHGELKSMQYHPSAAWLREHGYSPALTRSVHIPQAAGFVNPQHNREQPWSVMHELAHAYHDRELSFENPRIIAAYDEFRRRPEHTSTLHISGGRRRHYALTNPMEFFAELTETYLGTNDFAPFVRGELEQSDPAVHQLMYDVWEAPASE